MIDGKFYKDNPAHTLPATYLDMVRLWHLCVGPMGYTGVWPDPGGVYDQPAIMIDAFSVMSSREASLRESEIKAKTKGRKSRG